MTGFGQAEGENGECRVAVSIRSVNHRFLDLAIRLADEHRELEGELRRLLDDRLARGRVDVRVVIEPLADEEASVAPTGQT
ncbi:MAG: YicC family protein, partial [Acidobacteriota bacterium]|nr:YicC family protein [Acidobacteriota bacterium]